MHIDSLQDLAPYKSEAGCPVASIIWPVRYAASSDARNTSVGATSSGIAMRFRTFCSRFLMVLVRSGSGIISKSFVHAAGATQFTVMPVEISSSDHARLAPIRPAFAAA